MQDKITQKPVRVRQETLARPLFKGPDIRQKHNLESMVENPQPTKELTEKQIKELGLKLSQVADLLASSLNIQNLFDHIPKWQMKTKMELTSEALENKFRDIVHSQEFEDVKLPKYQISHRQSTQNTFTTNPEIMKHFTQEEITEILDFLDKIVICENRPDLIIDTFKKINGIVLNFKQQVLAASLFIGSSQKLSSESETGRYENLSKIESLENNGDSFIRGWAFTLPHIEGHQKYKKSHTHFKLFAIKKGLEFSAHIHLT